MTGERKVLVRERNGDEKGEEVVVTVLADRTCVPSFVATRNLFTISCCNQPPFILDLQYRREL